MKTTFVKAVLFCLKPKRPEQNRTVIQDTIQKEDLLDKLGFMDNLYANSHELLADDHGKWKKVTETSDNIYANQETFQSLETIRMEPVSSGAAVVRKNSCKRVAVSLGLLCFLLLSALITVAVFLSQGSSHWKMEMIMSNNSYNNRTEKQTCSQTTYNSLTEDRNRLQTQLDEVIQERNELQRSLRACHQEWVFVSGSLYYISSRKQSWRESRNDCLQRNADLLIINSKEEQEFARSIRKSVWIGLTDIANERTWKWVDGTPLTESYWATGEPNGNSNRDEDCAEIQNFDLESNWNDDSCDKLKNWICEKSKINIA